MTLDGMIAWNMVTVCELICGRTMHIAGVGGFTVDVAGLRKRCCWNEL